MVKEEDSSRDFYEIHARLCKAMAHPTRLHILDLLKSGSKTVSELAADLGIAQANLSQHLAILRQIGMLETTRVGANIEYKIANPKIVQACALVKEIVSEKAKKQNKVLFGQNSPK
jgi:DNA-binding transcriptional ArsR family regulator